MTHVSRTVRIFAFVFSVAVLSPGCWNPFATPRDDFSIYTRRTEHDALLGNSTSVDPTRGFYGQAENVYQGGSGYTTWSGTTGSDGYAFRDFMAVPGVWSFQEANGPCAFLTLYDANVTGASVVVLNCDINTGYNNSQYTAMDSTATGLDNDWNPVGNANNLGTSTLFTNDQMQLNDVMESGSGEYALVLESDGNLVLYYLGTQATWASGTSGSGGTHVVMQSDGNLVMYDGGNNPVWATGTWGNSGAWLGLQDDGNLVIYDASGTVALWALW